MRSLLQNVAVWSTALWVSTASADPPACPVPPPAAAARRAREEITTAKALFDKSLKLQAAGKLDEACDLFESSLRLDPQIGTWLNVADCRERQGRLVEAHTLFSQAFDEATRIADPRVEFVRKRVQTLEASLVRVTIRVAEPQPLGVSLRVGACPIAAVESVSRHVVMPGTVTVDVSAPGRKSFHVEQSGAAGAELAIEVPVLAPERDLAAERKVKEAEALAALERRRAQQIAAEREQAKLYDKHPVRPWTVGAGAVGAAALGVGVYFGVAARRAQAAFDSAGCGDRATLLDAGEYAACGADRDRGKRDAVLGNAFLIGGAALLGASTLVFVLDPGNVDRPERPHLAVTPGSIDVVVRW